MFASGHCQQVAVLDVESLLQDIVNKLLYLMWNVCFRTLQQVAVLDVEC